MGGVATKRVNLALQGGGAHGAFGWGVLDRIAEDGRLEIEGLCATSAGSMNAVVYAQGTMAGGHEGARGALERFWRGVSETGRLFAPLPAVDYAPFHQLLHAMAGALSPYQFNPFNLNPLRDLLDKSVDFAALHACRCVALFICATNVRTGQPRIFGNEEVTLDAVMASACLPSLFQAVKIGDEHYWDGGYMGNPALYPLFYNTESRDVVIVHINPIVRQELPTTAAEIQNRLNEISFNSSLLRELRAIAFVNKLTEEGWLKDEYRGRLKRVLIHSIRSDEAMCRLPVASKYHTDWSFLRELRDRGRVAAARWLEENFDHLGHHSTVDLKSEYLAAPAVHEPHAPAL